ncbi:MAG: 30S ribosomal protein S17 [Thermoflexales bacterium]|nr:30S ribosomal protein S17 [Thermoflexales bacterium]MCS7324627.1 30S ribosomal protein S17 [Thermoflexales bacterium]MCX7939850.1 30S ribosomal protein S17 [Thermoflexales bacterium]MDW8053826.1 30S ribosomal protein S17 [Anaerolineae bacterium]MDW8292357.1 30S ribosomal protein S17 [Anaerolineae bacterium]
MSEDRRRRLIGVVISDKMQKTIVVRVSRTLRHPLYKKVITRSKNYKAHDEHNTAKPGDVVQIVEHRPISKTKRWMLEKILERRGA